MIIDPAFRRVTFCAVFVAFSATAFAQSPSTYPPITAPASGHAPIWLTQYQQPAPVDPIDRRKTQAPGESYKQTLPEDLFGNVN